MVDAPPKPSKDRHPEVSSPIIDLGLEARIARAEQAVIDRDARVRGDARRIVHRLRLQHEEVLRWGTIAAAGAAACAAGYAGYQAWRGRKARPTKAAPRTTRTSGPAHVASRIAAFVRLATHWASKLSPFVGGAGPLSGMVRSALWPGSVGAPPGPVGADAYTPTARGGVDVAP